MCINSQLTEKDKADIIKRIMNGSLRFLFTTSLLELGMDIPNIQHIINIGWPITGKNGLIQRMGRLRFQDISQKKNFTLILDTERVLDKYYLENYRIIKTILEENTAEQILFNSQSLQRMKAFVLFRIYMGITTIEEILAFSKTLESKQITQIAIVMLIADGILRTRNHKVSADRRELIIADEQELFQFIRNHKIRSAGQRRLLVERNLDNNYERIIGEIEEQRILRTGIEGNLLYLGRQGDTYRVEKRLEKKIVVKKLQINKSSIEQNKLKAPSIQIDKQARVFRFAELNIRFGKMVIQRETAEVVRYTKTGNKIDDNHQHKQTFHSQEKTSGLLVEVTFSAKKSSYKKKKEVLNLLKDLILKSTEITLHISEPSFRVIVNVHESKIAIYDRGGELGNAAFLFRKFTKVAKQMSKLVKAVSQGEQAQELIPPLFANISEESIGMVDLLLTQQKKEIIEE